MELAAMSRALGLLGLSVCLLLAVPAVPVSALSTSIAISLDNVASVRHGEPVAVRGMTTAVLHICCAFQGTIAFKASVDGSNFEPLGCQSIADNTTIATSTTTRGLWRCNITGINSAIRADVASFQGGMVSVWVGLTSGGFN